MSLNFPVMNAARQERFLAILEAGAYPTMLGGPIPKQEPIYTLAETTDIAEMILPGPAAKTVTQVDSQTQEQLRRLRPMTRW